MIAAFRKGEGDYIHLQGPAPQQLRARRCGPHRRLAGRCHRAVRLLQPCRYPRVARPRHGQALHARLSQGARLADRTPAAEVAKAEASFFPDIDLAVLTSTIATYQKLGNWTPHVEITRPALEATVDIFQHAGLITKRHRYEDVVAQPPA